MTRLARTVWLGLACLTSIAQGQLRILEVDAARPQGRVRFHTEARLEPKPSGTDPLAYWAAFADTVPDRTVIPLSLGPLPAAASPQNRRTWMVLPSGDSDPRDAAAYDFRAIDPIVKASAGRTGSLTVRLDFPVDGQRGSEGLIEAARRVVRHFNQARENGQEWAIREWLVCPAGTATGSNPESKQAAEMAAAIVQVVRQDAPEISVGTCVPPSAGFAFANRISQSIAGGLGPDFVAWEFPGPASDPYDPLRLDRALRQRLDHAGLAKTASRLMNSDLQFEGSGSPAGGGLDEAAFLAAALIYLQDGPPESVPVDVWNSTSGAGAKKRLAAFRALGQMAETPQRLAVRGADTIGFAVLAGRSEDQTRIQILVANYQRTVGPEASRAGPETQHSGTSPLLSVEARPAQTFVYSNNDGYDLDITNLPWGAADFAVYRYRIDQHHDLEQIWEGSGRGGSLHLEQRLPPPGIELIDLQQQQRPVYDRLPRRRGR